MSVNGEVVAGGENMRGGIGISLAGKLDDLRPAPGRRAHGLPQWLERGELTPLGEGNPAPAHAPARGHRRQESRGSLGRPTSTTWSSP